MAHDFTLSARVYNNKFSDYSASLTPLPGELDMLNCWSHGVVMAIIPACLRWSNFMIEYYNFDHYRQHRFSQDRGTEFSS